MARSPENVAQVSDQEMSELLSIYNNGDFSENSIESQRRTLEARAIEAMNIATELEDIYRYRYPEEIPQIIESTYSDFPGITNLSQVKDRAIKLYNIIKRVPDKGLQKSVTDLDEEIERLRLITQNLQQRDYEKALANEDVLREQLKQDIDALAENDSDSAWSADDEHVLDSQIETALTIDRLYEQVEHVIAQFEVIAHEKPELQPLVNQFDEIKDVINSLPFDKQVEALEDTLQTLEERLRIVNGGLKKESLDYYLSLRAYVEHEAHDLHLFVDNSELYLGPTPTTEEEYITEITDLEKQRQNIENTKEKIRHNITESRFKPARDLDQTREANPNSLETRLFVKEQGDALRQTIPHKDDHIRTLYEKQLRIHDISAIASSAKALSTLFQDGAMLYLKLQKMGSDGFVYDTAKANELIGKLFQHRLTEHDQSTATIDEKHVKVKQIHTELNGIFNAAKPSKKTSILKKVKLRAMQAAMAIGIVAFTPSKIDQTNLFYPSVAEKPTATQKTTQQKQTQKPEKVVLPEMVIQADESAVSAMKEKQKPRIVRNTEEQLKREKTLSPESETQPNPQVEQVFPTVQPKAPKVETVQPQTIENESQKNHEILVKPGDTVGKIIKKFLKEHKGEISDKGRRILKKARKDGININRIEIGDTIVIKELTMEEGSTTKKIEIAEIRSTAVKK